MNNLFLNIGFETKNQKFSWEIRWHEYARESVLCCVAGFDSLETTAQDCLDWLKTKFSGRAVVSAESMDSIKTVLWEMGASDLQI